ncbi:MAG: flavodoxin-dependent (E)-4-hydroxy-3-methylbut-2-enyl-diphosphate synthase, partial [Clostridiales bacterium]|nr:flavodoxin-dependent (E)-4-hydroxy-3-methylbut-2-enyl-diphosphate synthase [Clostridiales bacterium]
MPVPTRKVKIGGVEIGGGAPVAIQSMCNTDTADVEATARQISALAEAGCALVRVAVPDLTAARALKGLKATARVPLIADVHFDHTLAVAAVENGADKVRVNPANLGTERDYIRVLHAAKANGCAIRIGGNGGSKITDKAERLQTVVDGCLRYARIAAQEGVTALVL